MNLVDRIDKEIEVLKEKRKLAQKLQNISRIRSGLGTLFVINIDFCTSENWKDRLHATRAELRSVIDDYQDRYHHTWGSLGRLLVSYKVKNYPVEIWLEFHHDDFPESLMPSEKCRIISRTSVDYDIVCDVEAHR